MDYVFLTHWIDWIFLAFLSVAFWLLFKPESLCKVLDAVIMAAVGFFFVKYWIALWSVYRVVGLWK